MPPCHGLQSEKSWLQRHSWIHWYTYDGSRHCFRLLATGYKTDKEDKITNEENRPASLQKEVGEATMETTTDSKDSIDDALIPLLARLSLDGSDEPPSTRPAPFPSYCIPTVNQSTLLFRTLTAYLSISALKPDGHKPCRPRDDDLLLPSTPNLYLYTSRGTHVGTAWVSTEEMYNTVVRNDEGGMDRLTVEIAVLSGRVLADWRTRNESPSTWQYMKELASAGMNIVDIMSRYEVKAEYEKLVARIYTEMATELGDDSKNGTVEVPPGFWERLVGRSRFEIEQSGKFPGHTEEELQLIVESLKAGGSGMSAGESAEHFPVLLIGYLGNRENNGSGGLKERIGIGEMRGGAFGSVDGLAFRDVLLR